MMKKKFKLLFPIIALVLAVTMMGTTIFAWFSMNKDTSSNGMQLQIEASPNLVISNLTSEITKSSIDTINTNSPFAVTFAANNGTYKPATHDSTYDTYLAGLKYVTDPSNVDILTGFAKSGATINVNGVVSNVTSSANPNSQEYYVDFVIYVASTGKALDNAKLKIKITSATKDAVEISSGSLMATSIDVYNGTEINESNYRGTLNVATKDSHELYLFDTTNHGATQTAGTVPLNTSYLTYTLRCYFDGALESTTGQAYIYTAAVDTSKVTLNLSVYVED